MLCGNPIHKGHHRGPPNNRPAAVNAGSKCLRKPFDPRTFLVGSVGLLRYSGRYKCDLVPATQGRYAYTAPVVQTSYGLTDGVFQRDPLAIDNQRRRLA